MTRAPGKRILIVEDNALNLELTTEVLGAHGYAVLQARTAEEGVRTLPGLVTRLLAPRAQP